MMGVYLNMLGNQKENPITGQLPDQNFAREIQQLMSIGLYQLNQDGTQQTDASGAPIPTYSRPTTSTACRRCSPASAGIRPRRPATAASTLLRPTKRRRTPIVKPMVAYPAFHSTVGRSRSSASTIPASTTADPDGDLKIALDTIFNHPNVGPFIGRQLIQRLVTSNPSPAYVSRVAAVFNNNGAGVRGDLGAVVKAILLDPEARDVGRRRRAPPSASCASRSSAWPTGCGPSTRKSSTGCWLIGDTTAPTLARPVDDELADGVQLLAPRLFAAGHGARPPQGLVRAGVPDRRRGLGRRLSEHHARRPIGIGHRPTIGDAGRRRLVHLRQGGRDRRRRQARWPTG